jgi:hypothetical protein
VKRMSIVAVGTLLSSLSAAFNDAELFAVNISLNKSSDIMEVHHGWSNKLLPVNSPSGCVAFGFDSRGLVERIALEVRPLDEAFIHYPNVAQVYEIDVGSLARLLRSDGIAVDFDIIDVDLRSSDAGHGIETVSKDDMVLLPMESVSLPMTLWMRNGLLEILTVRSAR